MFYLLKSKLKITAVPIDHTHPQLLLTTMPAPAAAATSTTKKQRLQATIQRVRSPLQPLERTRVNLFLKTKRFPSAFKAPALMTPNCLATAARVHIRATVAMATTTIAHHRLLLSS